MNDSLKQGGVGFVSAQPIWPRGREKEMNLLAGFRCAFAAPKGGTVKLRVAAATFYRAFLNGQFLNYGPARGPHGYYRVDDIDLTGKLQPGRNIVAIEVAGYNVNGFSLLDQPSFLQAEILSGGQVLGSTAGQGQPFEAGICDYRIQKVQRYGKWRSFIEVYRFDEGYDRWRSDESAAISPVETAVQGPKVLLDRGVPLGTFTRRLPKAHGTSGRIQDAPKDKTLRRHQSIAEIGPERSSFPAAELEVIPTDEYEKLAFVPEAASQRGWAQEPAVELSGGRYHLIDFGVNLTGFIGAEIVCQAPTRLWLVFDEILIDGDVDIYRLHCANIIDLGMQQGRFRFESIEPYTLAHLKLVCVSGRCRVSDVSIREYAFPETVAADFSAGDERLNRLYRAGVETFRQNSPDLFMDCPSRERSGWLCDSFFTARPAFDLGALSVERNFLENYLLPTSFPALPEGMLPMCYPSDNTNGAFIPNWAMWLVIELEEYGHRSGDRDMVEAFRSKVLALLGYFKRLENSDGLLEKLENWVFLEWSAANHFTQDVNYPSNMLYAGMLDAAARMYGMSELAAKAEAIRQAIRRQSFDGEFFVDNALRQDGKLVVTRNRTETCQYYAFFFGVAAPATHGGLWKVIRDQFGPHRVERGVLPEIHPSNSFIGNMLRVEILSHEGLGQQILNESIDYLLYMVERTGTLWEHIRPEASCNHAFASHIVHTLYRDVLGLREVNVPGRSVQVCFGPLELQNCQGRIPTPHGPVELTWQKEGGTLRYRLQLPQGYTAKITNASGLELCSEG